jgi:hypothetical protein
MTVARARLELHWAAQIASAAGATLLPAQKDASHTTLAWDDAEGALVSAPIERAGGLRVGIRFDDLAIVVLGGARARALPLRGKTLDDGIAWLATTLGVASLTRPEHELPAHPVARGEAFADVDPALRLFLRRWFSTANRLFTMIASADRRASPVRCWPHHFDIATLIQLDPERSVGVGLSPGDATYGEPYFYVTPWPHPPADRSLAPLARGHWHREGWTGAVLEAKDVADDPESSAIAPWLADAVSAALALVGP